MYICGTSLPAAQSWAHTHCLTALCTSAASLPAGRQIGGNIGGGEPEFLLTPAPNLLQESFKLSGCGVGCGGGSGGGRRTAGAGRCGGPRGRRKGRPGVARRGAGTGCDQQQYELIDTRSNSSQNKRNQTQTQSLSVHGNPYSPQKRRK